jgi:hypothetical protein
MIKFINIGYLIKRYKRYKLEKNAAKKDGESMT